MVGNEELKIEYLDINALKPYETNARRHTQNDIDGIKASIEEFGFLDAIGIWGNENIIVEGHGRLEAAKQLGYNEVPVVRLDRLTDEQRRAYALAHNKTAELSEWDFNVLDAELGNILEIDMEAFGFDAGISDDDFGTDFELPDGEKSEFHHMAFIVCAEQEKVIKEALAKAQPTETFGNTNEQGNKLYEVCREWEEQKTLS